MVAHVKPPTPHPNSPRDGWQMSAGVLDRRSRAWRRRCEIVEMFRAAVGVDPDPVLAAKIDVAAELAVAAEIARARFLAGDGSVTADDLVRITNQAFRAETALNLSARQKPSRPDLGAYLASRAA